MSNVILTTACNLRCPCCFAGGLTAPPAAGRGLSAEDFAARLDFLARSGIDEARLIGGEPTLHPLFTDFVEQARQRFAHVVVFTHGLIGARPLAYLAGLPPEGLTVLVNTTATRHADGPTTAEQRRRADVLRRLGPRAVLGYTITNPRPPLADLLPLIAATGCRPDVRLGLAQPIDGGDNVWLHPRHYRAAGQAVAAFATQAHAQGVRVHFDCGFVACMFAPDERAQLAAAGVDVAFRCSPVLDLDVNGDALACFPLGRRARLSPEAGATAAPLRDRLAALTAPYRVAGVYKECSACPLKARGECPGGCLAATLRRFQATPVRLTVPSNRPAGVPTAHSAQE